MRAMSTLSLHPDLAVSPVDLGSEGVKHESSNESLAHLPDLLLPLASLFLRKSERYGLPSLPLLGYFSWEGHAASFCLLTR